jgi:hypothetical protein
MTAREAAGNIYSLLKAILDEEVELRKAQVGLVDATINGRYFGDYLSREDKAVLRDLAVTYVCTKIADLRVKLRDCGFEFDDGATSVSELKAVYEAAWEEAHAQ